MFDVNHKWAVLLSLAALLGQQALADGRGPAWPVHVVDSGLSGADGVRLLDVDKDGDMDLTVGWEQSGVSRLYLNPGPVPEVCGNWPAIDCGPAPAVEDAMMSDMDGDGRIDVVSCTEGGNKRVLVHFAPTESDYTRSAAWTTAEFPESLAGDRKWMFALALDVNEDGRLDIVAGGKDPDGKVAWFEAPETNRRDLERWRFHEMSNAIWIMSVIAQDMDGDGDTDIVVSDARPGKGLQGVRWLENPAPRGDQTGHWPNHFISEEGDHADFMALADMDGDGDLDAIAPGKDPDRITWHERLDASGLNWTHHEIAFPPKVGHSKGVKVGDINLDGQLDVVLSCASAEDPLSGLVWLEYGTSVHDSIWIDHEISGPAGKKFDRIELIDLDGDGDLDALTTEESSGPDGLGIGAIWYENPKFDSFGVPEIAAAQTGTDNPPPPDGAKGVEFSYYDDKPLDLSPYELKLVYETDFSEPQRILREKELFENAGDKEDRRRVKLPPDKYDWVLEGEAHVKMNKGRLEFHTYTEGSEWNEETREHMVLWNTREFPENFLLEFDVSPIDPKEGLAIVFFCATGREGENIFALNQQYRGGSFKNHTKGEIDCYHISYWAGRGYANLRKNAGAKLKISGMDHISSGGPGKITRVRVLKVGPDIKLETDGKNALQWSDPGDDVYGAGRIGLRNMAHSHVVSYGHFKVWEVSPK